MMRRKKNILQKPKKYLGFMIEIKSEPLYNYQRKHGQASQTVTQFVFAKTYLNHRKEKTRWITKASRKRHKAISPT